MLGKGEGERGRGGDGCGGQGRKNYLLMPDARCSMTPVAYCRGREGRWRNNSQFPMPNLLHCLKFCSLLITDAQALR
ncbi:MAG: hypothetical protein ACHBN1_05330 [Heteroscytonema crispum UTEX LB 1556]